MHFGRSMERRIKVLIDTNILVDYLQLERKGHALAWDIFQMVFDHLIEATISTQSFFDAVYVCMRNSAYDASVVRDSLLYIRNCTNVYPIDAFDLESALKNANPDIEDNAQISFAYSHGCDILVTRDKKFLSREVPRPMQVMTPEDFVNACRA